MAYIGAEPVPGQNREVDDISSGFNGNATAFTLQVNSVNVSPESAKNILDKSRWCFTKSWIQITQ